MKESQIRISSLIAIVLVIAMLVDELFRRGEASNLHINPWRMHLILRILFFVTANLIFSFKKVSILNVTLELIFLSWIIGEFIYWGIWSSTLVKIMLPEHDAVIALFDASWVAIALLFTSIFLLANLLSNLLALLRAQSKR